MKRPFFILAIFIALLIAAFRFFVPEGRFAAGHITHFAGEKPRDVVLKGLVVSGPVTRDSYFSSSQIFALRPELIKISSRWFPVYGDIQAVLHKGQGFSYGDELLLEAAIKLVPAGEAGPPRRQAGSFNYRKYMSRLCIYATATVSPKDAAILISRGNGNPVKASAHRVREFLRKRLERLFRAAEREFLAASLLGERQNMPSYLTDLFIKTQTMHLVAISGMHIAIIIVIILYVFSAARVPRNMTYICAIAIIIFYAIIVGGRPSVSRAAIMGTVFLGSNLVKKDTDIYNSLGLAAVIILLYNPDQLFDAGFILSFLSIWSLAYIAPVVTKVLRVKDPGRPRQAVAVRYAMLMFSASLAVFIGLSPFTARFFNIVSPASVAINILAIPIFTAIIGLATAAIALHILFPPAGFIFADAAKFFIDLLIGLLKITVKMPFSYFEIGVGNSFFIALYYLVLIMVIEAIKKRYFVRI